LSVRERIYAGVFLLLFTEGSNFEKCTIPASVLCVPTSLVLALLSPLKTENSVQYFTESCCGGAAGSWKNLEKWLVGLFRS